jgi:hypothetical protein
MSKERLTTEEIQQEIRKVLQSVALNGYDLVCAESDIIKASEAFAAQEVEAAIADTYPKEFVEWIRDKPSKYYYPPSYNLEETYQYWLTQIRK